MPLSMNLASLLRPGDTVAWSGGAAEPTALLELFNDQVDGIANVNVLLGFGLSTTLDAERVARHVHVKALGGSGTNRRFANSGMLDVLPVHYSHLPDLVRNASIKIDVVLTQLTASEKRITSYAHV